MSWIETRDALIVALNTVDGINAQKAENTKLGSAWVLRGERIREDGWFIAEHKLYVVLPQKIDVADVWIDDREDSIVEAIESTGIAYVASISNVELVLTDNTVVLALLIALRST